MAVELSKAARAADLLSAPP